MQKPVPVKRLIKKADKAFSDFIRRRDNGICVTCGIQRPIKQMQAGHYYSRVHYGTRYNEMNTHCQCYRCNIHLKGNAPAYAEFMYNHYTGVELAELKRCSQQTNLNLRELCKEVIEKYTKKLLDFGK